MPRSRLKTYGDKAFSPVAPRLWNQLPPELRGVTSVNQFRMDLKTYGSFSVIRRTVFSRKICPRVAS